MRLTDLNPKWFAVAGRRGQGVTFDCPGPCCAGSARKARLAAAFSPTLDGGAPIGLSPLELWPSLGPAAQGVPAGTVTVPPGIHWSRKGDTFDTLSLFPSIDCSPAGHWHGWVQDGEVL